MDYMTYVRCIRKRLKRNVDDCEFESCEELSEDCESCNDCNCDYCNSNNCQPFCSQCCLATTCSTSSCCHKTCHSQCRTTRCRKNCKKSCTETIIDKPTTNNTIINYEGNGGSLSIGNITTIITLHTSINNTNIIDVPIVVNNTNINNFTLETEDIQRENYTISNNGVNTNCCTVVGPRRCSPSYHWPFLRCFHQKSYQCGGFCNSDTVHMQPFQNCANSGCGMQMMYVPQPRPQCAYHHLWPYVLCGMNQQQVSCDGCYEHYAMGGFPYPGCSPSCYDEGYGIGSYYRQGPFYRRAFAHAPPCFLIGMCFPTSFGLGGGSFPEDNGGYPPNYYQPPAYYQIPFQFYNNSLDTSSSSDACANETEKNVFDGSLYLNESFQSVMYHPSYTQAYYPPTFPFVEYPKSDVNIEMTVNRTKAKPQALLTISQIDDKRLNETNNGFLKNNNTTRVRKHTYNHDH